MLKVKFFKGSLIVRFHFDRPILDWTGMAAHFFRLIHEALMPDFPVNSAHLSVNNTTILGEAFARYNIAGGANTMSLRSDYLEFEFGNLQGSDREVALNLTRKVHDKFGHIFPSLKYNRVETQANGHDEVVPPGDAASHLAKFRLAKKDAFENLGLGAFADEPIAYLYVRALDQHWECRCGVERSLSVPNGIYYDVRLFMNNQSSSTSFDEKISMARKLNKACFETMGISHDGPE